MTPRSTSTRPVRGDRRGARHGPSAAGALEHHRRAAPATLARFCWPRAARTYVACYRAAAGAPTQRRAAVALRTGHRLVKLHVVGRAPTDRQAGRRSSSRSTPRSTPSAPAASRRRSTAWWPTSPPQATDERFLLLSTAAFQPSLAPAGRRVVRRASPWPYPQKAFAGRPAADATLAALAGAGRTARLRRRCPSLGLVAGATTDRHAARTRARPTRSSRSTGRPSSTSPTRPPFGTSVPFLYEPWDLQHRHHPEFFDPAEWRCRDRLYREGCERAALVVTATRWTKRDIVEQYGIAPEKIAVIPRGPAGHAPDRQPPRRSPGAAAVARPARPVRASSRPMTFPHKNHLRLFEALAILRDRHGIRLPLVCTGRPYEPHWPADPASRRRSTGSTGRSSCSAPSRTRRWRRSSRPPSLLVFPSLFEGLGPAGAGSVRVRPAGRRLERDLPARSGRRCRPLLRRHAHGVDRRRAAGRRAAARICSSATREAAPAALARCSWPKAAATFVACYRAVAGAPLSPEQRALYAEATES